MWKRTQENVSRKINLCQIVEVEPMFKGGAIARLRSGKRIDISRRYAAALKEKLGA